MQQLPQRGSTTRQIAAIWRDASHFCGNLLICMAVFVWPRREARPRCGELAAWDSS